MPKQVENYILERVIGKGQFGEVYKGYNKIDGQDIAIKSIERKFKENFQNYLILKLKYLNNAIMKISQNYTIQKKHQIIFTQCWSIAMKVTFIMQGDLMDYLQKRKKVTEQEAVEFLLQIFNGFKTLHKYHIMHRDFKLANLLKHNGCVKIADFGFSKILDEDTKAQTMLGSPLNMAPEILNSQPYDYKADIWSVGTVFYELLFGVPPFTATNILDLVKNIKNKPLSINKSINNISPICEDVIRRMLTVDPKARISWEELFNHKITTYQDDKLKLELEKSFKSVNLSMSMSKFYIKNNVVIDHPSEIDKKRELNQFAIEHAKKNKNATKEYKGEFVNRQVERKDEINKGDQQEYKDDEDPNMKNKETQREIQIKKFKKNSNRILHERNIYATVAEESIELEKFKYSEIVGFLLVKKLLQLVQIIKFNLLNKNNIYKLDLWEEYSQKKDYKDISDYIIKEYDVFSVYFDQLLDQVQNNFSQNTILDKEGKNLISSNLDQNLDSYLQKMLRQFVKEILESFDNDTNEDQIRSRYCLIDKLLDCLNYQNVFIFEDSNQIQFNFKSYYYENKNVSFQELSDKIETKIDKILF